jgi:hypothetical protein
MEAQIRYFKETLADLTKKFFNKLYEYCNSQVQVVQQTSFTCIITNSF